MEGNLEEHEGEMTGCTVLLLQRRAPRGICEDLTQEPWGASVLQKKESVLRFAFLRGRSRMDAKLYPHSSSCRYLFVICMYILIAY